MESESIVPMLVDESFISCPITKEIMFEPVCANDGRFYELTALKSWLEKHSSSPVDRKDISSTSLIISHNMKTFIDQYLELNSHRKQFQYVRCNLHLANIKEVEKIILNGEFVKLYNFNFFRRKEKTNWDF